MDVNCFAEVVAAVVMLMLNQLVSPISMSTPRARPLGKCAPLEPLAKRRIRDAPDYSRPAACM